MPATGFVNMCALQAVIPPTQHPSDSVNRKRRAFRKRSRRRNPKYRSPSLLKKMLDVNKDDASLMGSVNSRSSRLRSSLLSPSKTYDTQSQSDTGDDDQHMSPLHGTSTHSRRSLKSILSRRETPISTRSSGKQSAKSSASQASDFNQRTRERESDVGWISLHRAEYCLQATYGRSPAARSQGSTSRHDESVASRSWEQSIASPLSMVSARTTGNASQGRSVRQPGSTRSMKIDDTDLDFNFDGYSDHASSRSPSFHNHEAESNLESDCNRSIVISPCSALRLGPSPPLDVIEGPQSNEGISIVESATSPQQKSAGATPTPLNLTNADNL